MSDSLSILPLIEALERSNSSARLTGSGPNIQYELWIDSGRLVHWESEPSAEPGQLLAAETASVWMRSFHSTEFKASHQPIKLYELINKLHDPAKDTKVVKKQTAPAVREVVVEKNQFSANSDTKQVKSKTASPQPNMEQTIRLSDHLEAETAPVPSPGPPPPAPPVDMTAAKPRQAAVAPSNKSNKVKESVLIDKPEGNMIVFTKGKKDRRIAGRAEDCDLVVKDSGASRNHCELYFDGTLIHIKDLNSSNGTFLNKKEVHIGVADDGDVLAIGDIQFTLKIDESLVPEMV
ncbi:MAG: FHA domain-containing protein [Verrucomicrobiota bacterium]